MSRVRKMSRRMRAIQSSFEPGIRDPGFGIRDSN